MLQVATHVDVIQMQQFIFTYRIAALYRVARSRAGYRIAGSVGIA
jgi:hypothetical protein